MRKYVRFRRNGEVLFGEVRGGDVAILTGSILDGSLAETGRTVRLGEVTEYLPPLDFPNILCIGTNYADHCRECASEPPKRPLLFIKSTNALSAHGRDIVLPKFYPDEVDYEAELAVVIGRTAAYVSEDEAMDCVLGYTCANDVSARDVQLKMNSQWAFGKSFDTFAPIGPFLVTGIDDPSRLRVRLRLNGELMQDQPVSDMIFPIARLISHLSGGMTLYPGTVILTGTPAGVGMGRTPPRYLRPGDVTEVDIEPLGTLRNRVR